MPRAKHPPTKHVEGTLSIKGGGHEKIPGGAVIIKKGQLEIVDKVRKKRRFKPGTVALREIKKYQSSTDTQIPKQSFQRVVREIAQGYNGEIRFQKAALEALHIASEAYLVDFLNTSNLCALHARRVTVKQADAKLAKYITDQA